MTALRKDLLATLLTGLAVLVFAATHEGWDVPLVGSSHRWAAAAILLLGVFTCGLGNPGRGPASRALAGLGIAALGLAVLALATGSLTALSLLVGDFVALWALSTVRHVWRPPHHQLAA